MGKLRFKIIIVFLGVFLGINFLAVKANEENHIFSLEIDGFWKPSDEKKHDFTIRNDYGERYYLDGLSFKNTLIKDMKNNKVYSLNQAISENIIESYNISVRISDKVYGEETLFKGKLSELYDKEILMSSSIYMDIDEEINFEISISMDPLAGNKYQNMSYQFILFPKGHKVEYNTGEDIKEPDWKVKGYEDENGNWRIDGYYDEEGNWHKGGYYDKDGVWHEDPIIKDTISKVNGYFKTGDKNITIITYEILLISCGFLIIYRYRKKENLS